MAVQTLRITLKKLKIVCVNEQFTKATISLVYKDTTVSIPNPRFIKNSQAQFYQHKIDIPIDSLAQEAFLNIYGIKSQIKDHLGKVAINLGRLTTNQQISCEFNNNYFTIKYEIQLLQQYKPIVSSDDEIKEGEFFVEKLQIPNISELLVKRNNLAGENPIFKNHKKTLSDRECLNKSRFQILSGQNIERSAATSSRGRSINRSRSKGSFNSSRVTAIPQLKFIEPITHATLGSPTSSTCEKDFILEQKFKLQQPLGQSRTLISKVSFPMKTIIYYIGVSFFSFVMGTIAKQGCPF